MPISYLKYWVEVNYKFLLIQFAFKRWVEFRANNLNSRSIAAMKGVGCNLEGVFKKKCKGSIRAQKDTIVLTIRKREGKGSEIKTSS
jgi:RimJ/RimL family protein N-acetyltransferase